MILILLKLHFLEYNHCPHNRHSNNDVRIIAEKYQIYLSICCRQGKSIGYCEKIVDQYKSKTCSLETTMHNTNIISIYNTMGWMNNTPMFRH